MPPDSQQEARRHWAEHAQDRLSRLTDAVTELRGCVEAASPTEVEPQHEVASGVVAASAALSRWLGTLRAPKGLGKAEGELAATAGVYRNAAVAYGSLSDGDPERCEARFTACVKLLHQGDDHAELFTSLLRKKLRAA